MFYELYKTSFTSPGLINVTQVLLELVTVREGGLCFSEFDDVFISLLNAFALAKFLLRFYEVFIR